MNEKQKQKLGHIATMVKITAKRITIEKIYLITDMMKNTFTHKGNKFIAGAVSLIKKYKSAFIFKYHSLV